jgi:hypothetical protein
MHYKWYPANSINGFNLPKLNLQIIGLVNEEMNMFCPHCNHQNPPGAEICEKCGKSLGLNVNPDTTAPDIFKSDPTGTVSDLLKWGILIITIFIPLVGIVMGIIYMLNDNPIKKATGKLWLYGGLIMVVIYALTIL